MDPDLAVLSSAAATTLVALMTTDGWERVKAAFTGLWQRFHPDEAEAADADLVAARLALLSARRDGDEEIESQLVSEWQNRLLQLLVSHDLVPGELRRLMEGLRPMLPPGQAGHVAMQAAAWDSSRINQGGRDQTIFSR